MQPAPRRMGPGWNMLPNVRIEDMQSHKRFGAQCLESVVSGAVHVADNDCFDVFECRAQFVVIGERDIIAEDLFFGHLVGAGIDCAACSNPPARRQIVFIDPSAKTFAPEIFVFFVILAASWINAVAQVLA